MPGFGSLNRIQDETTRTVLAQAFKQIQVVQRALTTLGEGVLTRGSPVDVEGERLIHVADPEDRTDAVNLRTLREYVARQLPTADREYDVGASGTAKLIDWANGTQQRLRLTGNAALSLANGVPGGFYRLIMQQDATGGRIPTWPADVAWETGVPPTIVTTPNNVIYATFTHTGLGNGGYLAFMTELAITAP